MNKDELHQLVVEYNWDDGLELIWPIVESQETEFATALLIYWRLGGPWLEESTGAVNDEASRLQRLVKGNLLSGFYLKGSLNYDPIIDNELSRVQIYKLKKMGFPPELLEPVNAT